MRKQGFYERYIKRPQDVLCALLALFFLSPVLLVTAVLVRIKLGSPVIFKQKRPGKDEKIFTLYKFRTMTDKKDKDGNLLPDEVRLTSFGKKLRATSLDELPELFNILKGDMAVVGPRPLLVRDMVFMTTKQRKRHSVRPGLTGLAQVNGRNAIDWEKKLAYDQEYIKKITFLEDVKIIWKTIQKALLSQEGITEEGMVTAEDYGDYLLRLEKIGRQEYEYKQRRAQKYQQGE
ncbi:sugar transferase [Clostridiaceae bacterium Marseille-Q3526]|nr:sugar transferase [Clostridiaceae bacterium Marseille-Q3526]